VGGIKHFSSDDLPSLHLSPRLAVGSSSPSQSKYDPNPHKNFRVKS
jgi:hypothetical protein